MFLKVHITTLKNTTKDKPNKLKNHIKRFIQTKTSFMLMEIPLLLPCQNQSRVEEIQNHQFQMDLFSFKKHEKTNQRKQMNLKVIQMIAQTLILTPIEIYSIDLFK